MSLGNPSGKQKIFYINTAHGGITITNLPPDFNKQALATRLMEVFKEKLAQVMVVTEKHLNGEEHAHVYLGMEGHRRYISTVQIYEALGCKQGDGPRVFMHKLYNLEGWIRYLLKWDQNPAFQGELFNNREEAAKWVAGGGEKVTQQVSRYLMEHSVEDTALAFPSYALQHMNQLKLFKAAVDKKKDEDDKMAQRLDMPASILDPEYPWENAYDAEMAACIRFWNNNRLFKRKCNVFMHGPKLTGKSRSLECLEKVWAGKVYRYQVNQNNWMDDWDPREDYKLIIADEMEPNAKLTPSWFNSFLDGQIKVERKGLPAIQRNKRIPMWVTSNHSLDEIFVGHSRAAIDAVKSRFRIIELQEGDDMQLFKELWSVNQVGFDDMEENEDEDGMEFDF